MKEKEQTIKYEWNRKKSPGYELITIEVLKKLPKKIRTCYFPIQWKFVLLRESGVGSRWNIFKKIGRIFIRNIKYLVGFTK